MKNLNKRNLLIEKTVSPALKFLKSIKKGKITIVHGHDLDSVCSATIFYEFIRKVFDIKPNLIASEFNYAVNEEVLRRLSSDFIIFVDLSEIPENVLKKVKSAKKILIVDHHPTKKYKGAFYSNPRLYDKHIYMPASYVSYKALEGFLPDNKLLWLAAIGTLADHGAKENADLFVKVRKTFPDLMGDVEIDDEKLFEKSLLGRIVKTLGSAEIVLKRGGAILNLEILKNSKDYHDILFGKGEAIKLLKTKELVDEEFGKSVKGFHKRKKTYGNVLYYEIKSKLNLKSAVSGYIQQFYDRNIIAVAQKVGNCYDISFRRGKTVKTDLGKLASGIAKNIPDSSGGGHEAAAAIRVPESYLEKFLAILKNIFSKG